MKLTDCNDRQKKAYMNIYHACNWLIGGLENTLLDYAPDTEEHITAKNRLADHEGLVNTLYSMAINEVYDVGFCGFGEADKSFLKDIRFCGKEWLMERCEARIKKNGY